MAIKITQEEQENRNLWEQHVKNKVKEIFGENAELNTPSINTAIRVRKFVNRSVRGMMERKQVPLLPYKKTYSAKNMSKFEKLIYLIGETEKILFPGGDRYFSTLLYDEYPIHLGIDGLFEIINIFVEWTETDK